MQGGGTDNRTVRHGIQAVGAGAPSQATEVLVCPVDVLTLRFAAAGNGLEGGGSAGVEGRVERLTPPRDTGGTISWDRWGWNGDGDWRPTLGLGLMFTA